MRIIEKLTETACTDAMLDALEGAVGGKLPIEYRSFLKESNGGRPDKACFEISKRNGTKEGSLINCFLGICGIKSLNIESSWNACTHRIAPTLLPIATDPFGNKVLLSLVGETRGRIYFFDHEKFGPSARTEIARSFSDFTEMLTLEPNNQ